ncbi:MAG: hypothetical protein LBE20_02630 [Deltaproteobacteria bacterium]|jgi:hypothetical protein|nr:hypothetical protein [Deltaproteobacteria bacterium]
MNIKFNYRFAILLVTLILAWVELVAAQEQAVNQITTSSSSTSSQANRYYTTRTDYKLKDPTQLMNYNLEDYYENVEYYNGDQSYLSVFGNASAYPYNNNYNFYFYYPPYNYHYPMYRQSSKRYHSGAPHQRPARHKNSKRQNGVK